MTKSGCRIAFAVLTLFAATAIAADAQTFTTLVNFDITNGADAENMSLVQGLDGNLYGTMADGGANGGGVIFKLSRAGELQEYNFCSLPDCSDGFYPRAGVTLDSEGTFYGTTSSGGLGGYGTIFKSDVSLSFPSTLYTFPYSGEEGVAPEAPLTQSADGNFYGTTRAGGIDHGGSVFEITQAGDLTTLHLFCSQSNCADGAQPASPLVQLGDGNLYGTTSYGGTGEGVIFKITPRGIVKPVYDFADFSSTGGLILGADGNLYGSTSGDIGYGPSGSIFKMTPDGNLTTFYTFCSSPSCPYAVQAAFPSNSLIQGSDGNLYGTTLYGGNLSCNPPLGCGTIFRLTLDGTLTTLYNFDYAGAIETEGAGALVQATDGSLYGVTAFGGTSDDGILFKFDVGLGPFVAFIRPYGKVGQTGGILGQGFTGTTSVSLNGTAASFRVLSDTFIEATVPAGATMGYVTVTTPGGTLTSNVPFRVLP